MQKWQYCVVTVVGDVQAYISTVIFKPSNTADVDREKCEIKSNRDTHKVKAEVICKLLDAGWEPVGDSVFKRLYQE